MHVENGRKRVERVVWPGRAARYGWKRIACHEGGGRGGGWKRKETRGGNIEISSPSLPFSSPLREKHIERRNSRRRRRRGDEKQKRKTKEKRKSWKGEREREREGGYPRTFSWVTNLYEFAWFIGRKFNNGRPDPPTPSPPHKKGCGERVAADSGIYDTLVWIPASPSNSTIFHRDTWYSGPIIDSARIYGLRFEHVLYHKRFMWTRVATDIYLPARTGNSPGSRCPFGTFN